MGFNDLWLSWLREIMSSGTSSILLNGIPIKQFVCKRGVRQGDPLSPLLYLFGSDLLQSMVNELMKQGIISRPIDTHDFDFPIIQYADNTLLIMSADLDQLKALKTALQKYSTSTGLKINFGKSQIIPINVSQELASGLAAKFGCQVGQIPFTYLGFPLGTTKPRMNDLMSLVCRLKRELSSSSSFLPQCARLQLINSTLASMPLNFCVL
jgi:hypothetical protein